jgi:hypothetical protein
MYLEMPHFRKEIIERRNAMAAGLCAWVINICTYHDILVGIRQHSRCVRCRVPLLDVACHCVCDVARAGAVTCRCYHVPLLSRAAAQETVEPKREALAQANAKLAAATEKLGFVQSKLARLEVRPLTPMRAR